MARIAKDPHTDGTRANTDEFFAALNDNAGKSAAPTKRGVDEALRDDPRKPISRRS